MAPMTRSRAPTSVPTDLMAHYYAQRATAGLIISEGSQVSSEGVGYISTPGIYTEAHIQGWMKVTQAVHDHGGLMFCQLWHTGRVSHPDFHDGQLPVAPSPIAFAGQSFTPEGFKDVVIPRALSLDDIKNTIEDYRRAAQAAKMAGFDGVEIHGANGYLPAQFLEDGSNQRQDNYGGSLENRARFLLDITDAAIGVWGADRVAVRLSPRNPFNGMKDSNPEQTYLYVVEQLEKRHVGILHLMESPQLPEGVLSIATKARKIFSNILLLNSGYDRSTAEQAIAENRADAIAFGTLFLANPDLPQRFELHAELNTPDRETFYGGHEKGYIDYPFLA